MKFKNVTFHDRIIASAKQKTLGIRPKYLNREYELDEFDEPGVVLRDIFVTGLNFDESMEVYLHGTSGVFEDESEIFIDDVDTGEIGVITPFILDTEYSLTIKNVLTNALGDVDCLIKQNNELNKLTLNYDYGDHLLHVIGQTEYISPPDEPDEPTLLPMKMTFAIESPNDILTLPIYEADTEYGINLTPYNYDFDVDWGDESPISHITAWNDSNKAHTYTLPGTYQVTISGICQALSNYSATNQTEFNNYLISIDQIGSTGLLDLSDAFMTCYNLASVNMTGDLSALTNLSYAFKSCKILTTVDLSMHELSNIESFEATFLNCFNLATINLSGVINNKNTLMLNAFNDCNSLTSLDLSGFTGANLTDMSFMCYNCVELTSLDLSNWITPTLYTMNDAFNYCIKLETIDISNLDTTSVIDTFYAFRFCTSLTTEMSADMFWNNPSVTDYYQTFLNCNLISNYADIPIAWK